MCFVLLFVGGCFVCLFVCFLLPLLFLVGSFDEVGFFFVVVFFLV